MSSNRFALIIANDQYEDESLSKLEAPKFDAYALAEVLGDPETCNFYVQLAVNKNSYTVNQLIEAFFDKRKRNDLLLLYFSGHGVKDEDGKLYFATPNTRRDRLISTGISASIVNELMRKTRSRSQVLLLDCCYSGAFAKGMIAKSGSGIGSTVGTNDYFQGRGRIVITASDSMQYAFEEDKLVEKGSVNSIFTSAIVEGIKTWEADSNGDNRISIHELYDFVDGYVQERTPNQQPVMWSFNTQGEMIIAERKYAPLVDDEEIEVYEYIAPQIPEKPQPTANIKQPSVDAVQSSMEIVPPSHKVQLDIQRIRLREAQIQYEAKLEALHKHANDLTESTSIEMIAEYTIEVMYATLGMKSCDFYIREEQHLRLINYRGWVPENPHQKFPLDGPGILVKTANTKKTILLSDIRKEPNYFEYGGTEVEGEEAYQPLSELCVPVISDGEVVAILNTESNRLDFYDERDQILLETLASHVASAIQRINLLEEQTHYEAKLEDLQMHASKLADDSSIEEVAEYSIEEPATVELECIEPEQPVKVEQQPEEVEQLPVGLEHVDIVREEVEPLSQVQVSAELVKPFLEEPSDSGKFPVKPVILLVIILVAVIGLAYWRGIGSFNSVTEDVDEEGGGTVPSEGDNTPTDEGDGTPTSEEWIAPTWEGALTSGWSTTSPLFDGVITNEEWEEAYQYNVILTVLGDEATSADQYEKKATIFVKNDDKNLFIALKIYDVPFIKKLSSIAFSFDENNNGIIDTSEDYIMCRFWVSPSGSSSVMEDGVIYNTGVEPPPFALDISEGGTTDVLGKFYHTNPTLDETGILCLEVTHPLDSNDDYDIALAPGNLMGVGIEYDTGESILLSWPTGVGHNNDWDRMNTLLFAQNPSQTTDTGGALDEDRTRAQVEGIIGWWQGEENGLDIIGGNHGTLSGDVSFTSGKIGQAFSFDGENDYIWIPGNGINELQELTVEAWVKINSLEEGQAFVYLDGAKAVLRHVREEDNHLLNFYMNFGGAPSDDLDELDYLWLGNAFQENVWYHIAGTYDGRYMRMYLNGELVGTHEVMGTLYNGNGLTLSNEGNSLDGLLDEVSIYNRALSDVELEYIYESDIARAIE